MSLNIRMDNPDDGINYAALAEQPDPKGVYVTDHLPVMVDLVLN